MRFPSATSTIAKIKDCLKDCLEALGSLRSRSTDAIDPNDMADNHYAELDSYLHRSHGKASGVSRYIERKKSHTEQK